MTKNIIFLIIYFAFSEILDAETIYYLLTLQCALGIITDLQKKKILITPIFIFYFGVIITNLANLALMQKVGKIEFKTYNYVVPKYIQDATYIWAVSSSLIIIGYQLAIEKSFASVYYEIKNRNSVKTMYYVLLAANILSVIGMGFNYRSGIVFKTFGLLNTIGILFFARLWGKEDNKTYRMYAISLYILETYIALTTSYLRFELILPSIYIFTGYFIGKQHLKYIFSYRIIPLLLIAALFSSNFASLQNNRLNFIGAFTADKTEASDQVREPPPPGSNALLDRNANLAQLTNIVRLVKTNGFYNGRASEPLLAALVPRFLWPDKPLIALGSWFALEIGSAYKSDAGRINNSINMTIPGELYLDFGIIGLILGSVLMGAFISMLWNTTNFYGSDYNLIGIIFGGYLLYVAILNFGADLQIVLTIISTYITFLIIKKILKPS